MTESDIRLANDIARELAGVGNCKWDADALEFIREEYHRLIGCVTVEFEDDTIPDTSIVDLSEMDDDTIPEMSNEVLNEMYDADMRYFAEMNQPPPEDDLNDLMWFFDGDHDDDDVDEGDDLIELAPVVVSRSQLIFDEQGRFICPSEIFNLIKSYLLLPRRNYEAKLDWWNYHHDLPYVTLRKAVFDYRQYIQLRHQTPVRLLPDTQSKAFRQLHALLDAETLEEEAFRYYSHKRVCAVEDCEEEHDLVVRPMPYRFNELIGVPLVMEQLVCGECIENGADYHTCGMCGNDNVKCEYLVYRDFNNDEYEYFSDYFCRDFCLDKVGGIRRKKVKACGHRWECGCDKQKCNKCVKRKNKVRCDDETCKVYYSRRNDNCVCERKKCEYCEELTRLRNGYWWL